jgi:hypothetical protein
VDFYSQGSLTPGASFTPLRTAVESAQGFNQIVGVYQINGAQIATTNLSDVGKTTFSPTLITDGTQPTVTYVNQTGYRAIFGSLLYLYWRVTISAWTGGSGSAYVGVSQGCAAVGGGGSAQYATGSADLSNVTLSAGYSQFVWQSNGGTNNVQLVQVGSNIGASSVGIGNLAQNADLIGSLGCRVN